MDPIVRADGAARTGSLLQSTLRVLEYLLLFVALPLVYRFEWVRLPLFPALWLMAVGCLVVLLRTADFDRRVLWNTGGLIGRLKLVVLPFCIAAPLLALGTAVFEPGRLLGFLRARPIVWAVVMLLYPLLSAYPQGIVYRAFIFHRYRKLLPGRWARILASALAFSVAHIVFRNWLAPGLALAGGLLFAWTYERTRSSVAATVQHALFGCYLFTIGLGWYFYYGAVELR